MSGEGDPTRTPLHEQCQSELSADTATSHPEARPENIHSAHVLICTYSNDMYMY